MIDFTTDVDLLSFYMKDYIEVIASFYEDGNVKKKIFMKGSFFHQESLLIEEMNFNGLFPEIGHRGGIFSKEWCVSSFKNYKDSLIFNIK